MADAEGALPLETAPGVSVAEVVAVTEADLAIPDTVPEMKI